MSIKKNTLTPDQEKGLRALLGLIEANYVLLQNGMFPGQLSGQLTEVRQWLERYHKDVKYQLPVPEVKEGQNVAPAKAQEVTEATTPAQPAVAEQAGA